MVIDKAKTVRTGEELDLLQLLPWVNKTLPGLHGTPEVTQYSGGASNWTYRLKFKNDDLILRRPPKGKKAKGAHNMVREYNLQKAIKPSFGFVPEMKALCEDVSVLGADFYLMERVEGIIPRKNLPKDLRLSEKDVSKLCTNFLDVLIQLHRVDYKGSNLGHLGTGSGFVERQLVGWFKRYEDSRTWNVNRGKRIMKWLEKNKPSHEKLCLTHNDFRFDNVVLNPSSPTEIIGVLDWELATIGDPLMDLGNSLAYWIEEADDRLAKSTRRQPTTIKGMMTRKEVIAYYCNAMGVAERDFGFYEVFGLFRLSVIAQQIYRRFFDRETKNPEYKQFWILVNYLHYRCMRRIRA
ncbi:MAG: phosphotransferase family protein [Pseudomonadota bacterium]